MDFAGEVNLYYVIMSLLIHEPVNKLQNPTDASEGAVRMSRGINLRLVGRRHSNNPGHNICSITQKDRVRFC